MGSAFNALAGSVLKLSDNGTGSTADTAAQLFNASDIQNWLTRQKMQNAQCTAGKNGSLSVSGLFSMHDGFLSDPELITLKKDGKKNTVTVKLSPETLASLIENMPDEMQSYSDLLMAPVFTGETMAKTEYTQLIASVYGADAASELEKSAIRLTLSAGRTSKTFTLPLVDLLTLTQEKIFSITW